MSDTTKLALGNLSMVNGTDGKAPELTLTYNSLRFVNTDGDGNDIKLQLTDNLFTMSDEDGTARFSINTDDGKISVDSNMTMTTTTGGFVNSNITDMSAVTGAVTGMQLYDETNDQFKFYENSAWDVMLKGPEESVVIATGTYYTGMESIVSLRKLNDSYTGACASIRRGGDNVVADIGFDSNKILDKTAFDAHCTGGGGDGNGYIAVWYDQTGNGNNWQAEESASSKQGQVIWSTINSTPNIPELVFTGATNETCYKCVNSYTTMGVGSSIILQSMFYLDAINTLSFLYGAAGAGANETYFETGTSVKIIEAGASAYTISNVLNNGYHTWSTIYNGGTANVRVDGTNNTAKSATAPAGGVTPHVGCRGGTGQWRFDGRVNEIIVWSTAPDDTLLSNIETDQNNLWVSGNLAATAAVSYDPTADFVTVPENIKVNNRLNVTDDVTLSAALTVAGPINFPQVTTQGALELADLRAGSNVYNTELGLNQIYNSSHVFETAVQGTLTNSYQPPPSAQVILSLRWVNTSYTGPCCQIRRSSDNATSDIYFNSATGVLSEADFDAFVGAGSGFVRTIYDQSGNGFDFLSTTTTRQPSLTFTNGIPAMTWNTSDGMISTFTTSSMSLNSGTMIAMFVFKSSAASGSPYFLLGGASGYYETQLGTAANNIRLITDNATFNDFTVATDWNNNVYHTASFYQYTGNNNLRYDGLWETPQSSTASTTDNSLTWGARTGYQYSFEGQMNELILFNALPTDTELSRIEQQQTDLWTNDQTPITIVNVDESLKMPTMELSSTTRGSLLNTLTTTQRDDIGAPSDGEVIYNSTISSQQFYNSAESSWMTNSSFVNSIISAATTLKPNDNVFLSGFNGNLTMPTGVPDGTTVRITDVGGNLSSFATNIIRGGTDTITGLTTAIPIQTNYGTWELVFYNGNWNFVSAPTNAVRTYSFQQSFGIQTLSDAATIAWDLDTEQNAKVTIAASRTLGTPTNGIAGGVYILRIIQGGTGSYTMTWPGTFRWPAGTAPTLSTGVGDVDIITVMYDGTNYDAVASIGFAVPA